ncbi:MAG TPA: OmpA family protein [Candidatus Limnocylindrales bacterium]|nr:OmpA family protein [Candidatus Limnocylindrales bacterium]
MHKPLLSGWVLAVALCAAACAPKNYVVLLENPEGGTGEVTVSTAKGERVLNNANDATTINRANRAPSKPWRVEWEKLEEVFARAFGARPDRPEHFTLYFEQDNVELTEESEATVRAMIEAVRARPAPDADVEGHTDLFADERTNDALSYARALKVRGILVNAGMDIIKIDVRSYGETRPVVPTPDGVREPRNRRVEVMIR